MLSEVDINQNGRIEFGEYLELMSSIKNGIIVHNRFAQHLQLEQARSKKDPMHSVDRSGGGL